MPALAAAAALAVAAAGCGSSSSSSTATSSSSTGAAAASTPAPSDTTSTSSSTAWTPDESALDGTYNGVDKKYMTPPLAEPKIKQGQAFKVGFLQIAGTVPALKAQEDAADAEARALGGSMIHMDAEDNPQKQITQLQDALTQGVNALIVDPLAAQALSAAFKKAQSQGIPIITLLANPDPTTPLTPGVTTNVDAAIDYSAYVTMKQLAATLPKGASFATLGFAAPVASLTYENERVKYWGQQLGLKFVGQVNAADATSQAGATAASQILTKYPDVNAIVTHNDLTAASAVTAARVAHKTDVAIATPNGGEPESVPLIKSGGETVVYRAPWEQEGQQAVRAAYDALTKQNLPLPKLLSLPGTVVTKSNIDSVPFIK